MKTRLKILLTNDDGYQAEGLSLILDLLKDDYEVRVVAPRKHQSGKSASINIDTEMLFIRENEWIESLNGSPADCVRYGLIRHPDTDIVVSGCNHGFNISCYTIYSGTLGAAMQATMLGYPSIAISGSSRLSNVKEHFRKVFDELIDRKLYSSKYCLNLNFPPTEKVEGLKMARLAPYPELLAFFYHHVKKIPAHEVEKSELERWYGLAVKDEIYHSLEEAFNSPSPESDVALLSQGFITMTPLKADAFSEEDFRKLKAVLKE